MRVESGTQSAQVGVPQGSVLGPTLLALFSRIFHPLWLRERRTCTLTTPQYTVLVTMAM